ncbi:RNA polymerase sigma factor [Stieleria varia]|uniref:RNA polymerase sigma factor n=1 Tax=Stieleria varia TaxID=2528005 RepID=UPI0018D27261|nr:RNA polymerase sigma factor [Stieleria varia]
MSETIDDERPNQLDIQVWYRKVFALCQTKLISASDSEDATQETFLRAISKWHELRSGAALSGWLRQIARNVCVDMIRRQQVRRTDGTDVETISEVNDVDGVVRSETGDQLMTFINELPEAHREIVLLHYYENMTYDDIAEWLGVARSTVNERLSKARNTLRNRLAATEIKS